MPPCYGPLRAVVEVDVTFLLGRRLRSYVALGMCSTVKFLLVGVCCVFGFDLDSSRKSTDAAITLSPIPEVDGNGMAFNGQRHRP